MFKNYFLIAIRTILKHKVSSLIAILGLALGLSASIIIFIYVNYQFTFDNFLVKEKRISRVVNKRVDNFNKLELSGSESMNLYTSSLIKDINGVKDVVTFSGSNYLTLGINNKNTLNEDVYFVSDNFFEIFDFEVISGINDKMQSEPYYVILDKESADMFFPNEDAVGKSITIQGKNVKKLTITGVVNIPQNSHLNNIYSNQVFVSENLLNDLVLEEGREDIYSLESGDLCSVYLHLEKDIDNNYITKELNKILDRIPVSKIYKSQELLLESIDNIYMNSMDEVDDIRRPKNQIIFLVILAIAMLSISVINSISILTSNSINRTKEVGIRLVMGSSRKDLIFQFLIESIILTLIALILSLVLTELFLPLFCKVVSLNLSFKLSVSFILFLILVTLATGILSGIYPALYLSSLKPVESLKGKNLLKLGVSKKILVILQFLFASIVLIFTLSVKKELNFLNNIDPGFNCNNLIYSFPGVSAIFDNEPIEKLQLLKEEIKKLPFIDEVSYTSYIPYSECYAGKSTYINKDGITIPEEYVYVSTDYFRTIDLKPIEGEFKFNSVVVMESVREYRDIKVGDIITLDNLEYPVSAIVKDYYLTAPLAGDSPKFHIITDRDFYFQLIKFNGVADLNKIKGIWYKFYPNLSPEIAVHTVNLQNAFPIILLIRRVMDITAFITLFLSVIGLIGLILHRVKLKDKEIGIRKVLGASFFNIMKESIFDTIKYEVIGVTSGIVAGFFIVKYGLIALGYPFPPHGLITISLLSAIFVLLTGCIITILVFTKSATANPSKALRYE